LATNFAYRKRQLELEKKRKKEEKLKRRQERGAETSGDDAQVQDLPDAQAEPAGEAAGDESQAGGGTAPEATDR
jgi:hypothetical protein